jgi:chloride channel 3/4/5
MTSSTSRPRPRHSRSSSRGTLAAREQEELGQNGSAIATGIQQRITEEIDEIKRYEDFTTIDWVQDAAKEQLRRSARKKTFQLNRRKGWWRSIRQKISELYDAGQAWIVVTLVGIAIGLNAAILNIITEWLADIKLGYCETAFYLNEQFCCWGADNPEDGKADNN